MPQVLSLIHIYAIIFYSKIFNIVAKGDAMDRHFFEKDPVLRDIFNHLGDAVYFIDSHGAILFMNKAAEILDGYTFEEARGRTVTAVSYTHLDVYKRQTWFILISP